MRPLELAGAVLSVLLLGSTFLAWSGHEQFGREAELLPDLDEGLILRFWAWDVAPAAAIVALVTAAVFVGHVLLARIGRRSPLPPPGLVLTAGGALFALFTVAELPLSDSIYNVVQPGLYIGLGLACCCVLAGVTMILSGPPVSDPAPAGIPPATEPREVPSSFLLASGFILVLASLTALWYPPLAAAEVAAAAIGFALKRLWFAVAPLGLGVLLAITLTEPCPDSGGDCLQGLVFIGWLIFGAATAVAMLAGALAGRAWSRD